MAKKPKSNLILIPGAGVSINPPLASNLSPNLFPLSQSTSNYTVPMNIATSSGFPVGSPSTIIGGASSPLYSSTIPHLPPLTEKNILSIKFKIEDMAKKRLVLWHSHVVRLAGDPPSDEISRIYDNLVDAELGAASKIIHVLRKDEYTKLDSEELIREMIEMNKWWKELNNYIKNFA